jgi:asparagine synthase (glutamine-hydrolysing)
MQKQPDTYLRNFFSMNAGDIDSPFFSHLPRWQLTSRLRGFLSDEVRSSTAEFSPYSQLANSLPPSYSSWSHSCQAEYLETKYLLPGYILSSQGDRMAMAHGVEARYPFLDHRVVEFATKLPARLKLRVLNEKYLLKRAAKGLIPDSILARSKQPYRAPGAKCFFDSPVPGYVSELLSQEAIKRNGIFDTAAVSHLVRKFKAGHALGVKDDMALTGILSTQLLVQQFIGSREPRNHGSIRTIHGPEAVGVSAASNGSGM